MRSEAPDGIMVVVAVTPNTPITTQVADGSDWYWQSLSVPAFTNQVRGLNQASSLKLQSPKTAPSLEVFKARLDGALGSLV